MKRTTYTIRLGNQIATTKAWNTALHKAADLVRAELQRGEQALRQPLQNLSKPDKWTTASGDVPFTTNQGRTFIVNITSDYENHSDHQ